MLVQNVAGLAMPIYPKRGKWVSHLTRVNIVLVPVLFTVPMR